MAQQNGSMSSNEKGDCVTLCRTKNGRGLKLVHAGKWFYVNLQHANAFARGERSTVVFNEYKVRQAATPIQAGELAMIEVEVV